MIYIWGSLPPNSASIDEQLDFYKSKYLELHEKLQQTKLAFDEFQQGSKELEEEQDNEIDRLEKINSDLKSKLELKDVEIEDWRSKYLSLKWESDDSIATLQKSLQSANDELGTLKVQVRELEQENDAMEQDLRVALSRVNDYDTQFNQVLEKSAMLESELEQKARIEEETQRLRDELRDLTDDLAIQVQKQQVAKDNKDSKIIPASSIDNIHVSEKPEPPTNFSYEKGSQLRLSDDKSNITNQLSAVEDQMAIDPSDQASTSDSPNNTKFYNLSNTLNRSRRRISRISEKYRPNNGSSENIANSNKNRKKTDQVVDEILNRVKVDFFLSLILNVPIK